MSLNLPLGDAKITSVLRLIYSLKTIATLGKDIKKPDLSLANQQPCSLLIIEQLSGHPFTALP